VARQAAPAAGVTLPRRRRNASAVSTRCWQRKRLWPTWPRSWASARRRWPTSANNSCAPAATRATDLPAPILRSDVLSHGRPGAGMRLQGTVRNVVDFGAFVDIGVKQDGLLHRYTEITEDSQSSQREHRA
jgi:hypothetical protein